MPSESHVPISISASVKTKSKVKFKMLGNMLKVWTLAKMPLDTEIIDLQIGHVLLWTVLIAHALTTVKGSAELTSSISELVEKKYKYFDK